jgi:hypothetical protein
MREWGALTPSNSHYSLSHSCFVFVSPVLTSSGFRAMMATQLACAGRGNDTRALHICDLMVPPVVNVIGPCVAMAPPLLLHGGNEDKLDREARGHG